MKKVYKGLLIAALTGGCFLITMGNDPIQPLGVHMKLVNKEIDFIVVEFIDHKPIFYDRFLEAEMRDRGILIPSFLVKSYGNKTHVRIEDEEFERAFKEVFVPKAMGGEEFKWVE